jgi:uncharacterized protein with GYD domain
MGVKVEVAYKTAGEFYKTAESGCEDWLLELDRNRMGVKVEVAYKTAGEFDKTAESGSNVCWC